MPRNGSVMSGFNVVHHEKDYPASSPIFKASCGNKAQRIDLCGLVTFTVFLDQRLTPDPGPQTDS